MWISVDEQLPEDGESVLIAAPGEPEPVWIGYVTHEGFWRWCEGGVPSHAVTHWMPLPELPQAK